MSRTWLALALALLVGLVVSAGVSPGQDGKKYKGTLPAGWRKLALTEEKVQKIYKAQTEHREKIDAFEEQIKKLKADERKEIEKVLTTAQKARLKEIREGEPEKPEEKKKDDKKKTGDNK